MMTSSAFINLTQGFYNTLQATYKTEYFCFPDGLPNSPGVELENF